MTERGGCVLYFFFFLLSGPDGGTGLVCHMDCEAHRGKGGECNMGHHCMGEKDREVVD